MKSLKQQATKYIRYVNIDKTIMKSLIYESLNKKKHNKRKYRQNNYEFSYIRRRHNYIIKVNNVKTIMKSLKLKVQRQDNGINQMQNRTFLKL